MTDQEFEVLDELYFVISFKELMRNLSWTEVELLPVLKSLLLKELVKCIDPESEEEIERSAIELEKRYQKILFLATKKGLMEHNSREV
ncbi:MAG: hypothetical protein JWO58_1149 [Chitinophagaceae bacterium]|nr:hypothetical protein [Chitinophagaceae bacterium]